MHSAMPIYFIGIIWCWCWCCSGLS